MKEPRDFPKAIVLLNTITTSFYVLVAVVTYYYVGSDVPAPALSALPLIVRKIAYGVATPTIVIAGVINGSVAIKYVYVRWWGGKRDENGKIINQTSFKALASWGLICVVAWTLAFLIAEAVPAFEQLLALVTALFCGWFSYGLSGGFWLYLNKGRWKSSPRKVFLTGVNMSILVIGILISGLGLYASGMSFKNGDTGSPFSCEDNATPKPIVGGRHGAY
ncbi:hypothetical protein LTS18_008188 [Coniosporium uncinatum]|uniref:Uncharacterized protein n=1 Tax=Coniosporium uncinatum TaxID=93489 RepID=A0ACC3DNV0_9PEZI|nr:hypothetical protein LTS18_008188 [Coniosporium uncinatum]